MESEPDIDRAERADRRSATDGGERVRLRNMVKLSALVALVFILAVPPAGAQELRGDGRHPAAPVERRPALAFFEGRRIDLAEDWGDAQACLVWRQGGVL